MEGQPGEEALAPNENQKQTRKLEPLNLNSAGNTQGPSPLTAEKPKL